MVVFALCRLRLPPACRYSSQLPNYAASTTTPLCLSGHLEKQPPLLPQTTTAARISRRQLNTFGPFRPTVVGMAAATNPSTAKPDQLPVQSRSLSTAACLIIGDEVLAGKTLDTNSNFFAKYCFNLGIDLGRIEVVPDDMDEIADAARRLSARYDFVVTSGGIGPTHDDMTYPAIAQAFGLSVRLHRGAYRRMRRLQPDFDWVTPSAQREAKLRMVRLPANPGERGEAEIEAETEAEVQAEAAAKAKGEDPFAGETISSSSPPPPPSSSSTTTATATAPPRTQALFVSPDFWVPIAVANGNVHILPGIPRLFRGLLEGLRPYLSPQLRQRHRLTIATPAPESAVAGFLAAFAGRPEVAGQGVKVGSYPRWGEGRNTVTLTGRDIEVLRGLVGEVEKGVGGEVVGEDEDDGDGDGAASANTP